MELRIIFLADTHLGFDYPIRPRIERTSLAEKDEPKGFFELAAGQDEAGKWQAQQIRFVELPACP